MSNDTGTIATADSNLHPWRTLGQRVNAAMTIDEALALVDADDHVSTEPLFDADMREVPTHKAIVSNKHGHLWVAGNDYTPTQRRRLLEFAYEIQGLSQDEAHVDTVGMLDDNCKFFAYLRYNDLVIDPNGVADRIQRGMYVGTSFNHAWSNIIGQSNLRLACMNELSMVMRGKGLQNVIKFRHTKNSEARMKEAAVALRYIGATEELVRERAEQMLSTHVGYGPATNCLRGVMDHFWPLDEDSLTDKARTRRRNIRDTVQAIYDGRTCRERLGDNAYTAYQALTEYLDHHRSTRGGDRQQARAEAAVFPGQVQNMKVAASNLVLS